MAISCNQPNLSLDQVQRRNQTVPWWQALLRPARWLWCGPRRRIAMHRTQALLEELDDRTLKDIGLNRMDVRRLFQEGGQLSDGRSRDLARR